MALNKQFTGRVRQHTVLAQEVKVSKNGLAVGFGKIAFTHKGMTLVGDFFSFTGELLPEDEYDVEVTGKQWLEIVASSTM